MFEEEYRECLDQLGLLHHPEYKKYLESKDVERTHDGYFSIDKKSNRWINPETSKKSSESDDASAYDLILKHKERLLSFEEPVRFIFFTLCTS